MRLAGFMEALSTTASSSEVFDLVCRAVAPFGYDRVGFFALSQEAKQATVTASGEVAPIIISNYPQSFTRAYQQAKRFEVDPALALACDAIAPVTWEDAVASSKLSKEQNLLVAERHEAGIYDEITCPIHGPRAHSFALRFAKGQPAPCDRAHLSALQVMAVNFYYTFTKFSQISIDKTAAPNGLQDAAQKELPASCSLSQREKEVLLWTSRGKSASSISIILDLSENTVNFYVKNAMRKLGTTNRIVAVVLAVRSGLIQP